jgi:hypothetical protein
VGLQAGEDEGDTVGGFVVDYGGFSCHFSGLVGETCDLREGSQSIIDAVSHVVQSTLRRDAVS